MRSPPPPLVLLVVKQDAARDRLLRVLGDAGANIDEAQGVSVALEKVQARRHPIVLTDSAELTRQLRPQDGTRGPHVILVSDEWSSESADGYRIGATECLGTEASYECIHARLGMARRIADLEASLQLTAAQNRKLSTIDELTGVASRRFFGRHFPREVARAARSRGPLSLIMCDIDHFKRINDTYGHPAGDAVLRVFTHRLQYNLRRGTDWVARLGGEEFAAVLPEAPFRRAFDAARKMRRDICERKFVINDHEITVTASFGICGLDEVLNGERKMTDQLLTVSDAALYHSKNNGRNRVTATNLTARK